MASDASGLGGCRAWSGTADSTSAGLPITTKELLPILVAGIVWGTAWRGCRVQCLCDNQAVVACLRSCSSRHNCMMRLLRNLLFNEAHFGFHLHPHYLDTHANHLADDLSRNHVLSFFFQRFLKPPPPHPQCPRPSSISCWTPEQTGAFIYGGFSSKVFWPGFSHIYEKNS